MQTIPAAVSFDIRKTEVRELPLPEIAADAGLLRIEMTGVCGSDWPYYLKYPKTKGALVLGHESVGRIERLGRDAGRRFGLKEGDRVALEEYLPWSLPLLPSAGIPPLRRDRYAQSRRYRALWLHRRGDWSGPVGRLRHPSISASQFGLPSRARVHARRAGRHGAAARQWG